MKVSDCVACFLAAQKVRCVFEVVGGMVTHLIDSIHRHGVIRLVSTHHEQAAAFAADGIARITGVPGIALATSGPGATNLITGIGSCYFDSSPAVFITGQVNRGEQMGSRRKRPWLDRMWRSSRSQLPFTGRWGGRWAIPERFTT